MSQAAPIYRLRCSVQHYDWGKLGLESKAAQFARAAHVNIDDGTPYAELWMGTHSQGPSFVLDEMAPDIHGTALGDLIKANPSLHLSDAIAKTYDNDLPFLFKVLSVRKSLSIQAHPDKALARELHAKFPKIYKDANHKPEMTVAITRFEALCGFRPLAEIRAHLTSYPELAQLVGEETSRTFTSTVQGHELSDVPTDIEQNRKVLRALFNTVMSSDPGRVATYVRQLTARLEQLHQDECAQGSMPELLLRLNQQFPDDVGVFCALFLNYIQLEPGQAMFLGANEPHAYLSGDCVECMAASDNVVRAGLTPKFKDVPVLVNMLTYSYGSAESQILTPSPYTNALHSVFYNPPIPEFSVILTSLVRNEQEAFDGIAGPRIFIVTEGSGKLLALTQEKALSTGDTFFVGANIPFVLQASQDSETIIVYHALCLS